MLTPKLGAESIFNVKSIKYNLKILGAGLHKSLIAVDPLRGLFKLIVLNRSYVYWKRTEF